MKALIVRALVALAWAYTVSATAQEVEAGTEYERQLHARREIGAVGNTPFGERFDAYSGGVSFLQEDVRLTGNGPDIVLARAFRTRQDFAPEDFVPSFGDWSLVLPQVSTLTQVPGSLGRYGGPAPAIDAPGVWEVGGTTEGERQARCTRFGPSRMVRATSVDQWWFGHQLSTPDGPEALLRRMATSWAPTQPIGGATAHAGITRSRWVVGCLPATTNGEPGESFLAIAPNGTRYELTHLIYTPAETVYQKDEIYAAYWRLYRSVAHMLVTKVVDRFGNWVTYAYDGPRLTAIRASDGRAVDLRWNSSGTAIAQIVTNPGSASERIWSYEYANGLSRVVRPDGSSWSYDLAALVRYKPLPPFTGPCMPSSLANGGSYYTGRITAPSGVSAEFVTTPMRHGRSYVAGAECRAHQPSGTYYAEVPPFYDHLTLVTKRVSGPGLDTSSWTFQYSPLTYSALANCNAGCPDTTWTAVTTPAGDTTTMTHSNREGTSEGNLVAEETKSANGVVMRKRTLGYAPPDAGPWPVVLGEALTDDLGSTKKLTQLAPLTSTTTVQEGALFSWQVSTTCSGLPFCFDQFANPTSVVRSSRAVP